MTIGDLRPIAIPNMSISALLIWIDMDGIELTALRVFHELSQRQVARSLGVTQPFVSQLERGERSLPAPQELALERLFAVGSPQAGEETFLYLVCQVDASGEIYAPTRSSSTRIFRERRIAEAARDRVREAGFSFALVVPVWRNGISQLVEGRAGRSTSVDEDGFLRELLQDFVEDRRISLPPKRKG